MLPGPEFYANMIAKMVEYSSSSSNFQQVFEEAISLMPSYIIGGIKPVAITVDVAYDLLSTKGSVYKSFKDSSTLSYNIDSLIDTYLDKLEGLPDMNSSTEPMVLNKQLSSGKNTKREIVAKSALPTTKSKEAELAKIKAKIREFNTTIPSIVALARATDSVIINNVADLQKIDSKLLDRELFLNAKYWVSFLFEHGFLNRAVVEKKIAMFNKFEVNPLCEK